MAREQDTRFDPVLDPERSSGPSRFRVSRRIIYWTLAVVVGIDVVALLVGPALALRWTTAKPKHDLSQQVTVTIERVNARTSTIRVAGDLVGILGMEVVVTPQTWIGLDRQLVPFEQLRDGLRARISYVRQGEQKIAQWISATSTPRASGSADAASSPSAGPRPSSLEAPPPAR